MTSQQVAPRVFHVMSKPTGAICNLDCDYCFFLSKESLYPGSGFRMPDDVLELAALLGVKYKRDARGQFAHSNVITVLDANGEIVSQQIGLNGDAAPTATAVQKLLQPGRP